MGFQCQQFYLKDDRCAMKVSTDSLLLGAWVAIDDCQYGADFGCGCGILALMLAQRGGPQLRIIAIERDPEATAQAAENVALSPWPEQVQVVHADISQYASPRFDLVISNPPYFPNALASPNRQRALARQGAGLDLCDWFDCASAATTASGQIAMVVAASHWPRLAQHSYQQQWFVRRYCEVKSVTHKPTKLVLVQWQRQPCVTERQALTIMEGGKYTDQFRQLTGAFYLAGLATESTSADPALRCPE